MNNIERNLYEFYRIFGHAGDVLHFNSNEFEKVSASNNSWPQMIYNLNQKLNPEKTISAISEKLKNNPSPLYLIAPESYISKEHISLLKKNFISPVKILMGMNMTPRKNNTINLPSNCTIHDLSDKAHLNEFAGVIRKELIAAEMPIQNALLQEIKDRNEIKITGLYYRETLVSALLALTHEDITGLYFIVTKKEYQKKGHATLLINFVLNQLYENQVKEVVLHANHHSFELYRKIGFKYQNKFIIYKIEAE